MGSWREHSSTKNKEANMHKSILHVKLFTYRLTTIVDKYNNQQVQNASCINYKETSVYK